MSNKAPTLIKSAKRVRDLGEVFTPDFLVERMLDQFPPDAWEPDKCWLEMTCGNGQFVLGVLRRKIVVNLREMRPFLALMKALDTTFGTDIMHDNISDCRVRIYKDIVMPYWREHKIYGERRTEQRWQVACVVSNNIRHTRDALKEDYGKFQHFADISSSKRERCTAKVKELLALVDACDTVVAKSDKRLHMELSAFAEEK